MTKKEAVQILRTRIVPTKNWQEIHEAIDMAIESLSVEAVQGWIPCSERLPEEGEKVLASTTNTVFTQVFKGTHGTSDSWWWNNNTIKTIYAWMPLPKPYREDGE